MCSNLILMWSQYVYYPNFILNMGDLDSTAAERKTTYEEIKEYVLERTGLKVSNLYIDVKLLGK